MDEQCQALVARINGCSTATQIKALEDAVRDLVAQRDDQQAKEIVRIFKERKARLVKGTRVASESMHEKDVYDFESVPWEDDMELVRAVVMDSAKANPTNASRTQRQGAGAGSSGDTGQGQSGPDASAIEESEVRGASNPMDDSITAAPATTPTDIWNTLFHRNDYLAILKSKALMGVLTTCPFRGVCWRLFLGSLPENVDEWAACVQASRQEFEAIRKQHMVDPRASTMQDLTVNNPLSQDEQSPWFQFFQDEELRDVIVRDVTRTFPEVRYFHTDRVYDMMTQILFCYSKLNPDISYRQGMHELLAPILMLLDQESIRVDDADIRPAEMQVVLNRAYVVHDAFAAFSKLMEKMKPFFEIENHRHNTTATASNSRHRGSNTNGRRSQNTSMSSSVSSRRGLSRSTSARDWIRTKHARDFQPDPNNRDDDEDDDEDDGSDSGDGNSGGGGAVQRSVSSPPKDSPLKEKLNKLQHELVRRHDPQLFARLEELQIPPQVFGIRWIRLLFSREFAFESTLAVWDALLADFALLDYLCLAMLMYIRDYVLEHDYVESLSILMRYPNVQDVQYLIQKALHLRQPKSYPDPAGWAYVPKPAASTEPEDSSLQNYISQATEWTMGLVDAYLPHWISSPADVPPQLKNMRFAPTVQDFRQLEMLRVQEALVRLGEEMEETMEEMDANITQDGRVRDSDKMFLLNVQLRKVCLTLLGRLPLEARNFPRVATKEEESALPAHLQQDKTASSTSPQPSSSSAAVPSSSSSSSSRARHKTASGRQQRSDANRRSKVSSSKPSKSRGSGGGSGGGGFFRMGRQAKPPPDIPIEGGNVMQLPEVAFEPLSVIEGHREVLRENFGTRYEAFTADADTEDPSPLWLALARLPDDRHTHASIAVKSSGSEGVGVVDGDWGHDGSASGGDGSGDGGDDGVTQQLQEEQGEEGSGEVEALASTKAQREDEKEEEEQEEDGDFSTDSAKNGEAATAGGSNAGDSEAIRTCGPNVAQELALAQQDDDDDDDDGDGDDDDVAGGEASSAEKDSTAATSNDEHQQQQQQQQGLDRSSGDGDGTSSPDGDGGADRPSSNAPSSLSESVIVVNADDIEAPM
ncbi:hypothetical protein PTSG_12373 [Salpingoeca rosetta]|uniref:Rab-GAP TBC domain-containing protein n=1 Tax=Salpingoeca rosetta (strain ATCC 50818 / BSB-021) TaxID=946362 RepID=F2UDB5_SALR5|nr:uncharacterized protein PTSG_12373 [Salpingoeca rosetta]EGD74610.1 hypothetical protein PTSG_12373 [Salpingoeca rosetta]|eukprot:XP_004992867.1 hypothetical protein PTSG_12373 [Salpingoeca rosetta]